MIKTEFQLRVIFLLASISFLFVLVAGRFLSLNADEFYFLHAAYASVQGWASLGGLSRPYDLYEGWLGFFIRKGDPSSLWSVVIVDSVAQITCLVALFTVAIFLQRKLNILASLSLFCGLLFFFTVGRLAEHRPDFIAVTLFSIGVIAFSVGFLSGERNQRILPILVSGVLVALSICFSPRVIVMVGCVGPMLAAYCIWQLGVRTFFQFTFWFSLGSVVSLFLVYWVFEFSIFEAIASTLDSRVVRSHHILFRFGVWPSFGVLPRTIMLVLYLAMLGISVLIFARSKSNKRSKSLASVAFLIVVSQFLLIAYDHFIFLYGYSYGLVAYILLITALNEDLCAEGLSRNRDRAITFPIAGAVSRCHLGFALIALIMAVQIPLVVVSAGHHWKSRTSVQPFLTETGAESALLGSFRSDGVVPALSARVSLCEMHPDAWFLSSFHANPICLRNVYSSVLVEAGGVVKQDKGRRVQFPLTGEERATATRSLGLEPRNAGDSFILLMDGSQVTRSMSY